MLSEVCVYSDSDEILAVSEEAGAQAVRRPASVSQDETTSEETIQRFIRDRKPDDQIGIMMLQCTTPFLKAKYIDKAIELFNQPKWDSVISVTHLQRYIGYLGDWKNNGAWVPFFPYRWLRQEGRTAFFIENGGFYLANQSTWMDGRRIGQSCAIVEMPWWESVEIDEPLDLMVCQKIADLTK